MKSDTGRNWLILIIPIVLATILITSLAIFPFVYGLVKSVKQMPSVGRETRPGEVGKLAEEGALYGETGFHNHGIVRTIPSLRETITPLRIAGNDFPYSAAFAFGAVEFPYEAKAIDEEFLRSKLGLSMPMKENFLALILSLETFEDYSRRGFPDAETLIALLEPQDVIAVIANDKDGLRGFVDKNDISRQLARLRL